MALCTEFLRDESGAITVDFVVLTAGVVVIAMLIAPVFMPQVASTADAIGDNVARYEDFLEP
jgi:Flp pilus assembly pilin Flp